jgi:hypothetical protein
MHHLTERGHRDVKKLLLGRTPGVANKDNWPDPRSKNRIENLGKRHFVHFGNHSIGEQGISVVLYSQSSTIPANPEVVPDSVNPIPPKPEPNVR